MLTTLPVTHPSHHLKPSALRSRTRGRRVAWLALAVTSAAGLLAGCASSNPTAGSTPGTGKATSTPQGAGGTAVPSPAGTGTTVPGLGGLAAWIPMRSRRLRETAADAATQPAAAALAAKP